MIRYLRKTIMPHALLPLACLVFAVPLLYMLASQSLDMEQLTSPSGRLAAAVAAHFTSAPSAISAGSDRAALTAQLILALRIVCLVLFIGLVMLRRASESTPLMALQVLLAVVGDSGLIYILAGRIGMLASLRRALSWTAIAIAVSSLSQLAQALAMTSQDHRFWMATMVTGMDGMAAMVCTLLVHLIRRERQARQALALSNAELRATHALLGEAIAAGERQRIARDLHDVAGHHLTALKLHLDLARRQAGEQAPAALATASGLAASLLAQVRLLVSAERDARPIDLHRALATMCASVPSPRIALEMDDQLAIDSPELTHALFCAVQEAVSNAMRHADASHMTIKLRRVGQGELQLDMEDDGNGSRAREGNGLRGMRERLAVHGGTLRVASATGQARRGFALNIWVPASGAAA